MYEAVFALLVAIVFAGLLVAIARPRGAGRGGNDAAVGVGSLFLFFFVILFLASLAGGLWLAPIGPMAWDVAWLPFILVGLFVALLLPCCWPRLHLRNGIQASPVPQNVMQRPRPLPLAFGLFFWILVIALLVAIGFGYWWN